MRTFNAQEYRMHLLKIKLSPALVQSVELINVLILVMIAQSANLINASSFQIDLSAIHK
jgi:hypothetical protein